MKTSHAKSRGGFTLVELLVGATLSAAVLAAVLSSYIFLARSLSRLANQQSLETEARRTLGHFSQDVQAARAILGTPTVATLSLAVPQDAGTVTVTYAYNSAAGTLTRTAGSSPAQTLLRNIVSGSCAFRYYDVSNAAYDSGSSPYTTLTTYPSGIKQVTLQFSTQTGVAGNGTRTPPYQITSGRMILRNRAYLP